jgi:hypothetical protein
MEEFTMNKQPIQLSADDMFPWKEKMEVGPVWTPPQDMVKKMVSIQHDLMVKVTGSESFTREKFNWFTSDLDADIVVDDIQYSIKMFYKLALDFISHTPYGVNQFAIQCVMKKGVILFNLNLIEAYSLDDTRFNRHFGYDKESAGTLHFRETIDASLSQLFK